MTSKSSGEGGDSVVNEVFFKDFSSMISANEFVSNVGCVHFGLTVVIMTDDQTSSF